MTKQYAKIRLEYTDYLIDLSDAQAFLNLMNRAVKLTNKYDSKLGEYVAYREGGVDCSVSLAKDEEINAPLYVKLEGE